MTQNARHCLQKRHPNPGADVTRSRYKFGPEVVDEGDVFLAKHSANALHS